MSKVLVTGGGGFIGSHLCEKLVEMGDDVVVLDNFSASTPSNLLAIAADITLIKDDIRNIGSHLAELEDITHVFHFAALISGHDSLDEAAEYFDVNVNGTLGILQALREASKEFRVLFASSSTVYGNQEVQPIDESADPSPPTVYALTKLACEHLLRMYSELYGYSYTSLRLFNVYGPRQNPSHPYANVTCKFAHAAANELPIKLFGDGEQSRDFVHVDDVVSAFLAIKDGALHPFYNVGTGEQASINHLITTLQEKTGHKFDIEQCPPWPNDIREIRADVSRLHGDFTLPAPRRLGAGLLETVEYFRDTEV